MSSLLGQLKFAQGAIKKNNISPELEYYQIKGGRVVGYNGYMALSAPIDLELEAKPKADLFYKALDACGDTVGIDMTPSGRLHIRSGAFSAYVACIDKEVYEAKPEGETYEVPPGLAATFKRLLPFISEDASRPWAMGLLVDRGCYTATNNVVVIQEWSGHQMPTFNCPRFAVAEVARIAKDPTHMQVSAGSISFHYADGSWLLTSRLATEWPADKMNEIMAQENKQEPLVEGFFAAVETLKPFIIESNFSGIYFGEDHLTTAANGAQEGAEVKLPGIPAGPVFNIKSIQLLDGIVSTIDWSMYPRPCIFYGDRIRGAIVGMQV